MAETQVRDIRRARLTPARVAGVVVAAIVVAVAVWLIAGVGDDDEGGRAVPKSASRQQLVALQNKLGRPVYWAGPRSNSSYELTQTKGGNVYVRYLPARTSLGDPRPRFLTVVTYPLANGYARLREAARSQGGNLRRRPDGGVVVVTKNRPSSAYLAYPGKGFQVEVYDPSPKRAQRLALSRRVQPVR